MSRIGKVPDWRYMEHILTEMDAVLLYTKEDMQDGKRCVPFVVVMKLWERLQDVSLPTYVGKIPAYRGGR